MTRLDIAEKLLGELLGHPVSLDAAGYGAPCPGASMHSTRNGKKDFQVFGLNPADPIPPTMFCLHAKCGAAVDAANKEFRRRIWFAENGHNAPAQRGHWSEGVAPEPKVETKSRPEIDMASVWEFTRGCPEMTSEWLRAISPVDVAGVTSGGFLDALYAEGERVIIFTDQRSQGDFLWVASKPAIVAGNVENGEQGPRKLVGGFRLSQQRSTRAVKSALPSGAKDGVWYLVQPVTGQWAIKSDGHYVAGGGREVEAKWTRRSQVNVTDWRHFVLESDVLEPGDWLKVLAQLPLPIAAVYTSGGRSIHALLRLPVPSKAHWDAVTKNLKQIVCPLGADPAALTAVRLSRLPGCKRGERMQELLYLNPNPDETALRLMPRRRA